jgi:hypothetical protein
MTARRRPPSGILPVRSPRSRANTEGTVAASSLAEEDTQGGSTTRCDDNHPTDDRRICGSADSSVRGARSRTETRTRLNG